MALLLETALVIQHSISQIKVRIQSQTNLKEAETSQRRGGKRVSRGTDKKNHHCRHDDHRVWNNNRNIRHSKKISSLHQWKPLRVVIELVLKVALKMEPLTIHVKNLLLWRVTSIYHSKHRINHRVWHSKTPTIPSFSHKGVMVGVWWHGLI